MLKVNQILVFLKNREIGLPVEYLNESVDQFRNDQLVELAEFFSLSV